MAPGSPASGALAQPGRKRIDFKDIQLFERREWEKLLFDRTGTSPIWSGEIPLGDYGYIAVDVTARWRANAAAVAGLGPGMLRRIWVDLDPNAERAEGHAELYIPADVGTRVLLGGSVEGHTSYLDIVPLLTLEGGLAGAGTASVLGALMVPVSVAYERGALGLVVNPKVGVGLLFTFNLDAWAAAALFGHELMRKRWQVVDWRWGRAWQLGVQVKVEYRDGKLSPIEVDFQAPAPLPIEDILPEALSASGQAASLREAERALMTQTALGVLRTTPSGSVTPSRGPDAGRRVSYGDTRDKHTKVADFTLNELKDAVSNPTPPPAGPLRDLRNNVGNPAWGSQLSKEATDVYEALVKDALENGTRAGPTRVDHTATFEVGIDIISGRATRSYRMYYSPNLGGWHVFPVR